MRGADIFYPVTGVKLVQHFTQPAVRFAHNTVNIVIIVAVLGCCQEKFPDVFFALEVGVQRLHKLPLAEGLFFKVPVARQEQVLELLKGLTLFRSHGEILVPMYDLPAFTRLVPLEGPVAEQLMMEVAL